MDQLPTSNLYPRARMDALTDGIYSVAMTLLVLDIRLPDNFQPASATQLLQGLLDLTPKLLPYLLSFIVLGLRWLSAVQVRTRAELLGGAYVRWWLWTLLLITCVPFTTMVVGRYASFAPAIWLYAGNTALIAVTSWLQLRFLPEVENDHHRDARQISLILLLGSALLCIILSFFNPAQALWALLLNLAGPSLVRYKHASRTQRS
jgi:uncharacterized membrane protein